MKAMEGVAYRTRIVWGKKTWKTVPTIRIRVKVSREVNLAKKMQHELIHFQKQVTRWQATM